jgi:hypothetical protein
MILNSAAATEAGRMTVIRLALLGIFILAAVGTLTELLLLEHFDSATQYIPLATIGLGLIGAAWCVVAGSPTSVRVFRGLMILLMASGIAGLALHYYGNAVFELDVEPEMEGWELFWKSMTGATPALAPGSLVQIGLVGLLYTWRHPAVQRGDGEPPTA